MLASVVQQPCVLCPLVAAHLQGNPSAQTSNGCMSRLALALYTKHHTWDIFCCAHPSCVLGPGPNGSLQRAGTCSTGGRHQFVTSCNSTMLAIAVASMARMQRLLSCVTLLRCSVRHCPRAAATLAVLTPWRNCTPRPHAQPGAA